MVSISTFERRSNIDFCTASGLYLSANDITTYLDETLGRKETLLPNLECPVAYHTRYEDLRAKSQPDSNIRYYFALNLRQVLPLLPQLIGSIVEAIRFLGPKHCALSIVEGNSNDGTADVLVALLPQLEEMDIIYWVKSSPIDPSQGDRIMKLAELRNLALKPLLDYTDRVDDNITVIFLNDIAPCPDDILELILQRQNLGADMTCAMDWTYVGRDPTFYDVWVARGINGDSFFDIPPDGNWNSAWNLFWNAAETHSRFESLRPFQVFSCWNGATAFSAKPLLQKIISFRGPNIEAGECEQGEPQLFCKDLWFHGFNKIAVVPSVNLEYSVGKGKMIKKAKGFTVDNVAEKNIEGDIIEWRAEPPEKVKCMPNWENQFWQLWDETLSK